MSTRTLMVVVVATLAAILGLLASRLVFAPPASSSGPALQAVRLLPQPRELPPFSLRQSDGTQLVPGELRGHWTLVFLGFTHCPDVCPTTLAELARAQKAWEAVPEAMRPRLLFVSVDPERDRPDRIGEYAHAFHKDTLAATADVPALEKFARSISLIFAKTPIEGGAPGDYTMDHSATLVTLDPQGRMAGIVQPPLQPAAIAADLLALTKDAR